MTKKFKKRSLSESNVTEKSVNKNTNDVPVSPKKLKVEAVPNAQNNAASKKFKKGAQGDANTNKKKQEKNKNENNVKKVTPTAVVKQVEENQSEQNQAPQAGLNRKERNKLKKAENNKLSKEKRKLFRKEEGDAKTKTAQLSPEQIKEKIKELESREQLSKTAKRKLGIFKKLLQVQEGTSNIPKNTAADSETTNSEVVAKKQNKKRSAEDVSVDNKTDKKAKFGKTTQNSKKQKNAKVQPGNLLRVKSKNDEDEDEDESNDEEETEGQVIPVKAIDQEDVEEDDDDDDEEDEEDEEDEDEDDDEGDENEVEDEDEDEEDDEDDEEENDDDEEENEDEDVVKTLKTKNEEKKKDSNAAAKIKGNEITNDKNQDFKKKRYVLHVSNIPYSSSAQQIKDHFLTKVSKIADVRIPKKVGTDKPRGFCYVELENQEDYEKALSLHHSFLDKRRIAVQYSPAPKFTNAKQIIVSKNKKLDALRKEGKLAGSKKQNDKKFKKDKRNAVSSTA